MKLPAILSAATIQALAATDTHAVRIILMSSAGPTNFTLRGNGRRRGKYILVRDGVLGRHILDVPVSIWNEGMPAGRYQDNLSISHDLMSKPNLLTPFVTMIVPWKAATEAPTTSEEAASPSVSADPFAGLSDLFSRTAAPEWVLRALEIAKTAPEDLPAFGDEVIQAMVESDAATQETAPEEPVKTETAAAKRMRLMRERKKALAADKLQTANA